MSKLRKSARMQDCMVRIPGVCNFDPETTVLAHLPSFCMGSKAPDFEGSFCCSSCHDHIDGRVPSEYSRDALRLMHADGARRTREWWVTNGYLKW